MTGLDLGSLGEHNPAVSAAGSSDDWDRFYTGAPPPWDIGRPQPALAQLAETGVLVGALLDVGCGTGEHTLLGAQHGADALGIDSSRRAIEIARRKATERSIDARFVVHDALALAALGERFDTVIDSGLFHVFDDGARRRYVGALHEAVRSGGHVHLMCFSDRQAGSWGPRRVSAVELRRTFAWGWRIESLTRARFEINPIPEAAAVEAWLVDLVRV